MNPRWSHRAGAGLAAAAGATALVMLVASPATASPLFCGAGRGLTAQNAIQGAFDDARNSAQSEGYYGACTLSGEPQIFEVFNDPYFGHIFRAQVNVSCER
ncbi:hypothetical protein DMB66_26570 [Actinoplanes sp. ATCC 53533]|uniref:hypothetical protein n=1 Tax=Actinoplanes sp. ATCC 53533 TaxID=1288362 RepID=UPI000F7AE227|nr:hypothetical protein [Actinoplanes sp. ATCC 53533]RSM59815.1 hypothetical protein DMB66_26570 [Actinoplanes sp. ATCC 53533]